MRIGITGSSSGIGKHLVTKISGLGHTAILLGRNQPNFWQLGEGLNQNLQIDALVHLAHDRNLSVNDNIAAAKSLCDSFSGPKILLSSFSAHSKSRSIYGKSKYEVENIFSDSNGCSLRAGIVYGHNVGGFFAQLQTLVKKSFIIPIPYRGLPLLFTTHIDDLVDELIINLDLSSKTKIFAAHSVPISLQELVSQIKETSGVGRPTLSISREPLNSSLKLFSRILPVIPMADSLLSLSRQASYEELSRLRISRTEFRSFSLKN